MPPGFIVTRQIAHALGLMARSSFTAVERLLSALSRPALTVRSLTYGYGCRYFLPVGSFHPNKPSTWQTRVRPSSGAATSTRNWGLDLSDVLV
jgi:hypothetical protein